MFISETRVVYKLIFRQLRIWLIASGNGRSVVNGGGDDDWNRSLWFKKFNMKFELSNYEKYGKAKSCSCWKFMQFSYTRIMIINILHRMKKVKNIWIMTLSFESFTSYRILHNNSLCGRTKKSFRNLNFHIVVFFKIVYVV